jgi:ligand-binding sensor domain-containing protein
VYRLFLIIITLTSLPSLLSAQFIPNQTLTEEDGLSDNRITCFMKDQTGFIWIGTENGLNRYDGHQFVIYRPGQSQRRISHEHINDVAQDRAGRLWIATWSGLNVLDPATDSLHVFTPDDDAYRQKVSGIASSITWDIYIDKTDRIWLALDVRDLCYYDPTTKTFSYFPWQNFVEEKLPAYRSSYKSIQKIHRKSDDELWLGTTLGLFSFNITTGEFRFHGGERPYDFTSFYYDEESGRAYFGQQSLFRYEVREDRLVRYDSLNEPYLFDLHRELIAMPTLYQLW